MARLEPLPREELVEIKDELDALSAANGYVANSFLIMGRRPEIAQNFLKLIRSVMRNPNTTLSPGLTWMVAHMCSASYGCQYCSAHTLKNGTNVGLPREKADALWDYETSALFTPAERAALDVARAGGLCPSDVSDRQMDELKTHFSAEQVVEIVAVIALFGFNNRWNDIMKTDLEPTVVAFREEHQDAFRTVSKP